MMENTTTHKISFEDSNNLSNIDEKSVHLIVTSPPYPMIEMWDQSFSKQKPTIHEALKSSKPDLAFEEMHKVLDGIWEKCERLLCDGGIACINIGDATRTIDKKFQLFSNHSRIISAFLELGFSNLPNIIWRKQTNAPNKFMGSGMYPPGAYVTLEHEFILVFRKGNKRIFSSEELKKVRRESAFFWEERNKWFSDLWDLKGTTQILSKNGSRNRSAAYPFEIPYRLINMFSVQGDTILDPFFGTGTTSLAAIASGRNSIGIELEPEFDEIVKETILSDLNLNLINNLIRKRILSHKNFIAERQTEKGKEVKYTNNWFNFPVITRQEVDLTINLVESITEASKNNYSAKYIQEPLQDYQGVATLFSQHD